MLGKLVMFAAGVFVGRKIEQADETSIFRDSEFIVWLWKQPTFLAKYRDRFDSESPAEAYANTIAPQDRAVFAARYAWLKLTTSMG